MAHDLASLSIDSTLGSHTLRDLRDLRDHQDFLRDFFGDLLRVHHDLRDLLDDLRDIDDLRDLNLLRDLDLLRDIDRLRDLDLLRDLVCDLLRCGFDDVLLHHVVKFIVNLLLDFDSHYICLSRTELSVANVWKQYRVEDVQRQNPKVMVKLYYELYHICGIEGTKDDYQDTICGYMTNVLWEGLYSKDFKTFTSNMQLFEREVTKCLNDIVDPINLRYILDCAQAKLAVAGGIYTKKGSRGDASRAFRVHVNKYTSDEKRYDKLRRLPELQNVSDDVLRYMTSESGAINIRKRGDASAHGDGRGEDELEASIRRQPKEVQHIFMVLRDLGLNYR